MNDINVSDWHQLNLGEREKRIDRYNKRSKQPIEYHNEKDLLKFSDCVWVRSNAEERERIIEDENGERICFGRPPINERIVALLRQIKHKPETKEERERRLDYERHEGNPEWEEMAMNDQILSNYAMTWDTPCDEPA